MSAASTMADAKRLHAVRNAAAAFAVNASSNTKTAVVHHVPEAGRRQLA
jgi:hypothetical protein